MKHERTRDVHVEEEEMSPPISTHLCFESIFEYGIWYRTEFELRAISRITIIIDRVESNSRIIPADIVRYLCLC